MPPKNYRPKEGKFKPEPYSQGPHAHAAHDAGGKLLGVPMPSRSKFDAQLAAYAPGCGSETRVPPWGGFARCGAEVNGKKVFCPYCQQNESRSVRIVNLMLA